MIIYSTAQALKIQSQDQELTQIFLNQDHNKVQAESAVLEVKAWVYKIQWSSQELPHHKSQRKELGHPSDNDLLYEEY